MYMFSFKRPEMRFSKVVAPFILFFMAKINKCKWKV